MKSENKKVGDIGYCIIPQGIIKVKIIDITKSEISKKTILHLTYGACDYPEYNGARTFFNTEKEVREYLNKLPLLDYTNINR